MDYNDEMKRLGEHEAMKEIPENFDDGRVAAPAAAPRKSSGGRAVLVAIGAALLAAAVFLLSDSYYTHKACADQARAARENTRRSDRFVTIDAIAMLAGHTGRSAASEAAAPSAATATAAPTDSGDTPDAVLLFPNNGSAIAGNTDLDALAREAVAENADVMITAYTDETGSATYNRRLSERRAKAVADYLIARGVAPSHIRTQGCGPTHAFASNALDRRAEVRIVS